MEYITNLLFSMAPQLHYVSFFLLILAGLNLPVSEDLVYIVSAAIAATRVPENTVYIFIGCFAGAYISDLMVYGMGRFAGRKILSIRFFQKRISAKRIERLEFYFHKYGIKTLFFGRFIPFGVRNVMFFTAGLGKMRFLKFSIVDFLALSVTSTILFSLGYSFGENYQTIIPYLNRYKIIIFGAFLLAIIILVLKTRLSKKEDATAL